MQAQNSLEGETDTKSFLDFMKSMLNWTPGKRIKATKLLSLNDMRASCKPNPAHKGCINFIDYLPAMSDSQLSLQTNVSRAYSPMSFAANRSGH